MLGVSGQSKSLSKRAEGGGVGGKAGVSGKSGPKTTSTTKLPLIASASPPKPQRAKAPQKKQKAGAGAGVRKEPAPAASGEQKPQRQSVLEIALLRLSLPPKEGECGSVKIRFNHYNKSFPLHYSVVRWSDVDEEYCLSFVYRGDFKRYLVFNNGVQENKHSMDDSGRLYAVHDESCSYFIDLHDKDEYTLEVVEDPVAGVGAEGLRLHSQPLRSADLAASNVSRSVQSVQSMEDVQGAHSMQ
jgi:hypothetical protein